MFELDYLTGLGILYVLLEVVGVALACDAVMRQRSSQGAIAWLVALVSMPVVTIPLYLLFGRTKFRGYSEAIRQKQSQSGEEWTAWYSRMNALAAVTSEQMADVEALVQKLTGIPFTRGNSVDLLLNGEATYDAMAEAIAGAEDYVFVQFYIVRDDRSGRRIRDALVERARAGVRVLFLYDEIGSLKLPSSYLDVMRWESIQVSGFKTTRGSNNRFQINFRNHRKLLIVDGRSAFIGGHNLGDEYLDYRDTHMKITGPAAQHIQMIFLKDWFWAMEQIPRSNLSVDTLAAEDQAVAIVNTGPADKTPNCSLLFSTLINMAQRRLWITSPYFVPDDAMVRSLQAAAVRGVDVRIILPGKADHKFVELASFTYYGDMKETGVRLYRYQKCFMHQKVILIDDILAGVGTVNLDNRSLYLNFEATGLVADQSLVMQVEEMLVEDLENSREVQPSHFDDKPAWFKMAARLARLASPLL